MSTAHDTDQDFNSKYTKSGSIGQRLLEGFFFAVGESVDGLGLKSAMEVGCGEGFSTRRLRGMLPGAELIACDIEMRLVEEARRRNPGVEISQQSIYELPHADGAFDCVFVMEVLEHLEDPERALAEVARVSGRYLLLTVPREPIWRILNCCRLKYLGALGNTPGHLNHWSAGGFAKFVGSRAKVLACRKALPWTVVLAEVVR